MKEALLWTHILLAVVGTIDGIRYIFTKNEKDLALSTNAYVFAILALMWYKL